jgi:hypothetical protein
MQFGKGVGEIADYCENHMKRTTSPCWRNAEFWYVKAGRAYRTTGL